LAMSNLASFVTSFNPRSIMTFWKIFQVNDMTYKKNFHSNEFIPTLEQPRHYRSHEVVHEVDLETQLHTISYPSVRPNKKNNGTLNIEQ
jgi:hypothetical protein